MPVNAPSPSGCGSRPSKVEFPTEAYPLGSRWEADEIGYLLGYDIGSSAIKAALVDPETGRLVASAQSPLERELEIFAPQAGWAEQDPEIWWENAVGATRALRRGDSVNLEDVEAVGISYQMHGLVIVDKNQSVLRPSIIWCDSRAVGIGEKATNRMGRANCLERMLNLPGNFTASKLGWVRENEPEVYVRIFKAMLPGDYLAMRLTGDARTTVSGLSEGVMWDSREERLAGEVLDCLGISRDIIPDLVPTFGFQGSITGEASRELGLRKGIPVSYRAGDQPNNALALNVLEPGEIAATAGTSGVVYGVTDRPVWDPDSRVNTFVHVNHSPQRPRYGVLLCINGTGILNSWLRNKGFIAGDSAIGYDDMNALAASAPVGSGGLAFLPYGNGSERTLGNRDIGASLHGLNFNVHDRSHVFRSAQEGIVFALNHGVEIMRGMGLDVDRVRAGYANMFLSPVFCEAFANTVGAVVELYNTDGAQGAARGAGIGSGVFRDQSEAFRGLERIGVIEPTAALMDLYGDAWSRWVEVLQNCLSER